MISTSVHPNVLIIYRLAICLAFLGVARGVSAATYTVNSPEDTTDSVCTHPYIDAANDCTLREAITAANAAASSDSIVFSIDASFQSNTSYYNDSQYTITLGSALPNLTGQTILSAASAWDTIHDRPGIRLYSATKNYNALTAASGSANSQISGLEIQGVNTAIRVDTTGITVGTNCDGLVDNQERNVLHSSVHGVYMTSSTAVVAGNYIGVDDNGTTFSGMTTGDIWINGAAADNNVIGFREGTTVTCSAATQRNVLAGLTGVSSIVYILGTGNNSAGDAATGADHNILAGNYIGTDYTGTQDLSGKVQSSSASNIGVQLSHAATLNWIGTDGDAVDDALEGNIINAATTGFSTIATTVNHTGNNRFAGNYIGVMAGGNAVIGNSMVIGGILQGVGNIVGWCDSTDHATLCSDSGTVATQRNVIGGASSNLIRFGVYSNGSYIYGNYIGVGADGSSDVSNAIGVFIHRSTNNNIIGGSGNRANVIKNNTIGIQPNGEFTGNRTSGASQNPITNTIIFGNTISNNDSVGIQLYWTENFGTSSITIRNNIITNNGTVGIDVFGSSPTITNNTIQNNSSYGIYVRPGLIKRNAGNGWNANEATASNDPADASTNILASPSITSNTISGNTSYGIYQLDSRSANYSSLFSDNIISSNNNTAAVVQAWYGVVELLDRNNNPIPSDSWASTTITATPANGTSLTSAASATVNSNDVIFGPASVAYTNVTSWFTPIDYAVSDSGVITTYNPYTITSSGTYTTNTGKSYTFDGIDNDTSYSSVLANGIATGSLYRFQIGKSVASTVPATPTNLTPTSGSTTSTVTPTLTASSFSDTTETHAQSTWQVYATEAACTRGGNGDVYNITTAEALTSHTIPSNILQGATTYYWHVAYTNAFSNTSSYSTCTSFTTVRTAPQNSAQLPALTWNEDEASTPLDLDNYFTDSQNDSLTYTPTRSDPNHISVDLNAQTHVVTLTATADWSGESTISFTACDPSNECTTSNVATLTVLPVNDAPTPPTGTPSPHDSILANRQPTFDWEAGTDLEDVAEQLQYDLWLATTETVTTEPVEQWTSTVGTTSLAASTALADNTKYYYSLRTIDSAGAVSEWSPVYSFTINTGARPNLILTKSLSVLESAPSTVGARLGAAVPPEAIWLFQRVAIIILCLSSLFCLIALVGLSKKIVLPKQLGRVLFQQPALAFSVLSQRNQVGTYTTSYSEFLRRVTPWRVLFQTSVVVTLIFIGWQWFSHITLADTTAVNPGDTIRLTVRYKNNGEAAGTDIHLEDTLPEGTQLVADSIVGDTAIRQRGDTLTTTINTLNNDETGALHYDVTIANPTNLRSLVIPVATATVAELPNETIISNELDLDVRTAALEVQVLTPENNPINQAAVTLYYPTVESDNVVWSNTTSSNGTVITSGLRSGRYWLTATADGYQSVPPVTVTIHTNDTTVATLVLSPIAGGDTNTNTNTNEPVENDNLNENTNDNTNTPPTNTNNNQNQNSNTDNPESNTNNNENVNKGLNGNTNHPPTDNTNYNLNQPLPEFTIDTNINGPLPDNELDIANPIAQTQELLRAVKVASDHFFARPGARWAATAVQTVGVLSWIGAASADVGLISTTAVSLNEIALLGGRFFSLLFGIRRKRQPWGVVYDAVTKRPLDPAYVTIHTADGKQVAESITDLDGRYEFFLPSQQYAMMAHKTHYQFPSTHLRGRARDEVYDNLYFGENFTTQPNEVITRNIPLDPVEFDWNEFEKNAQGQFHFYKKHYHRLRWLGYGLFGLGLVLSLFTLWVHPTWWNSLAVGLYGIMLLLHFVWLPKRRSSALRYHHGGPIPFAVIKIYSARLKRQVKTTVTDAFGRFYVLLQPGKYYWTVEIRRGEHDYEMLYQAEPMELKLGVLPKRIIVPNK